MSAYNYPYQNQYQPHPHSPNQYPNLNSPHERAPYQEGTYQFQRVPHQQVMNDQNRAASQNYAAQNLPNNQYSNANQPNQMNYFQNDDMPANRTYTRHNEQDLWRNENLEDESDGGKDLYQSSRSGFVKKVYFLLSMQLLITTGVCVWAMNSESFTKIFGNQVSIILVSVLLLAMSIVIGCCIDVVRQYGLPILIVFTLLFSILVGVICSYTKSETVLLAAGITAVIVIGLTAYACITDSDLTGCGPYLFIVSLVVLIFGIVLIFWKNPIAHLIYACLAGLLFCVYLIFDTQMVLGKGKYSYTLDDAYFAAIQLYIDIIEIFLQILRILSYLN